MINSLLSFIWAVFGYWFVLIPGGLLTVIQFIRATIPRFAAALARFAPPKILERAWQWSVIGGVFVACFLAYHSQAQETERLRAEVDQLKPLLGNPPALQKQVSELQAEISRLRATRWSPLNIEQARALRERLTRLRPRPITVTYSGSESYVLAKSFDDIFAELKWPRPYALDKALGGGEGIRFFPHTEADIEVMNAIAEATGFKVQQFPFRAPDGGTESLLYIGFPPD